MREQLEEAARRWATGRAGQRRLEALRAVCDTFVPAVIPPRTAGHMGGYWERRASDLRTHVAVAGHIASRLREEDRDGLGQLLDLLAFTGFRRLPQMAREAEITALSALSDDIATGFDGLRALTMWHFYSLPGAEGGNPNWEVLGYPGPPAVPVRPAAAITPLAIDPAAQTLALEADVCVVGSGAGGGVIAGELAAAGLDVVVLEAGEPPGEAGFAEHELEAFADLYWRGGPTPTDDGQVTMLAGGTLGGGTTVNWAACVPPPAHVRAQWADEHGLTGVDSAEFDAHLDAVSARMGITDACNDLNDANRHLAAGADALGWSWKRASRNVDPQAYDPESAGHIGFGDRSGAKLGVTRTYLADAAAAGARVVVGCRAERIIVEGSRAAGVRAAITRPDGSRTAVTVRARTVVAACGALETPALLLRSAIGGPAVGHHLRVHPVTNVVGLYPEEQRPWWGPPLVVIVDEFAARAEGHGFLVECPHYGAALLSSAMPWRSGRDHKLLMGKASQGVAFLGLVRERGAGRVRIDDTGEAVVTYPLDDWLDREHLRQAFAAQARLHAAAGALGVVDFEPHRMYWRRGTDIDDYCERALRLPFGRRGRVLFSAHQMGSARMGTDPTTSVADPDGQLHDTPGVWIGDTSAFPTATGSNPMLTCLALARRTARAIVAAG